MKKHSSKQHCFHAYLISTGTASTETRICFSPSCFAGAYSRQFVPQILCPVFVFLIFRPSLNIICTVIMFW